MVHFISTFIIKTHIQVLGIFGGILPNELINKTEQPDGDEWVLKSGLQLTILNMINYLLGLAGAVCMFFIISGAFDYVGGWKIEQKQGGKNKINYAIGGLILVCLSWVIVNTLINFVFNFNLSPPSS